MPWLGSFTPTDKQILEFAILKNKQMENDALQSIVAANTDKNFVERIVTQNANVSNSNGNMDGTRSTHLMASGGGYVFPDLILKNGFFSRNNPSTGEDINMSSDIPAQWFANNYKRTNPQGFETDDRDNLIQKLQMFKRRQ